MPPTETDRPAPAPSQERLDRVLEASGALLYLLTPVGEEFVCAWMSDGVRHLLGYTPEEVRAPGWFPERLHPDDRHAVIREARSVLDDGRVVQEFRFRHRAGHYLWFRQELRRTPEGEIAGVAVDVTERKEAERAARETEQLLHGLLQAAPEAVITSDREGSIRRLNPAAEQIFGYDAPSLVGRPFTLLFPERFRTLNREMLDAIVRGEIRPHEADSMRGLRRSGEEFPAEVSVFPHAVQGRLHVSAIVRDVTQRKALEAEREQVIGEFREALDEVRALRDILPICAACKDIRDDQGYWHRVETYLRSHGLDFSHGICPACAEAIYGELASEPPEGG